MLFVLTLLMEQRIPQTAPLLSWSGTFRVVFALTRWIKLAKYLEGLQWKFVTLPRLKVCGELLKDHVLGAFNMIAFMWE